jgi:hypothetical protein
VAGSSQRSLLVVRACYMAVRRARQAPLLPTGVVVVREPGRVLHSEDIADAVGAPLLAEIEVDPAVARAVDAGLLNGTRLPRSIERSLRHAS